MTKSENRFASRALHDHVNNLSVYRVFSALERERDEPIFSTKASFQVFSFYFHSCEEAEVTKDGKFLPFSWLLVVELCLVILFLQERKADEGEGQGVP